MLLVMQFRIFMSMKNKTRHLSIRLTEDQFRRLADKLIDEQKTISEVIRDLIRCYTYETIKRTKGDIDGKN
jgi:hypothetical protein